MNDVFDAGGCITDQGLDALSASPPGAGAPELAAHLAACSLCQERLLARSVPGGPTRARTMRSRRTIWLSIGAVLAALVVALVAVVATLLWLRG